MGTGSSSGHPAAPTMLSQRGHNTWQCVCVTRLVMMRKFCCVVRAQFHVVTYMDNTIPGVNPATQRSGRPIKSISQVRPGSRLPQQLCAALCAWATSADPMRRSLCMVCACEVAAVGVADIAS